MKHYAETVCLDMKHVYQALPRLLSLWFEFNAIGKGGLSSRGSKDGESGVRV